MEKELVIEINEKKNDYKKNLERLYRDEYIAKIDAETRAIRALNNERFSEYLDDAFGGHDYMAFDEAENTMTAERFDELEEENENRTMTNLLGLYAAVSERYATKGILDKILHPVDSYREYKALKTLEYTMNELNISKAVVTDYMKEKDEIEGNEMIPVDEALDDDSRTSIEISVEEKAEAEFEPFEEEESRILEPSLEA